MLIGSDVTMNSRGRHPNSSSVTGNDHATATLVTTTTTAATLGNSNDRNYYQSLLKRANNELKTVQNHQQSSLSENSNNSNILQEAREIASKVGLSIESDLRNINVVKATTAATSATTTAAGASSSVSNIPISTTTGGFSNTDHIIVRTGLDERTDRINEYRRQYMIRQRTVTNCETKLYTQKWDKHRVIGERRRRIIRDIDLPTAPTEPPPSGYILFLGQMTTKLRYESYKENQAKRVKHDQTKMVQEISNLWKSSLDSKDRDYYHNFHTKLKSEYRQQLTEYRATGYYTPSTKYIRNHTNVGLWTHIEVQDKNALELEIATYDTIHFPSTHLDNEEQQRRINASKEKRKLKEQQQREDLRQSGSLPIKRRRRRSTTATNPTRATPSTNTEATSTGPNETKDES
jgi:hypothetical protein